MRKILLIVAFSVIGLVLLIFLLLWQGFGPVHSSETLDLGANGELHCNVTYTADLAATFYNVEMSLETINGKQITLGSMTFNDEDWIDHIVVKRKDDWLILSVVVYHFATLKFINTASALVRDTTLRPSFLQNDSSYNKIYHGAPQDKNAGESLIEDFPNTNEIVVNFEYDAEAAYPTHIPVSQKITYRFNTSTAKLETVAIAERILR